MSNTLVIVEPLKMANNGLTEHLIAASPDLFKACEALLHNKDIDIAIDLAEKAVTKAKG